MQTLGLETIASHAEEFQPRRFLINGHLQTIAGNYLSRINGLLAPEVQLVEVSPATANQIASQVLCHCHWQPAGVRAARPTAIIVHGLEGSSDSQYVVGNSNKLWQAGCNVVRMNMRNCGDTEALSPTLYHSGLSNDVLVVMNFFVEQYGLQSMSLISPAVDLQPSADALHLPQNRLYELKFLYNLLRRFRRKAMLFPHAYDRNRAVGIRSLREFDNRITALYSGFTSADDYYNRAAASRLLTHIAVPTLILNALDDPFVRITDESRAKIKANPNITLKESKHGGHCAFLAQPDESNGYDGYWAEHTLLRFLLTNA